MKRLKQFGAKDLRFSRGWASRMASGKLSSVSAVSVEKVSAAKSLSSIKDTTRDIPHVWPFAGRPRTGRRLRITGQRSRKCVRRLRACTPTGARLVRPMRTVHLAINRLLTMGKIFKFQFVIVINDYQWKLVINTNLAVTHLTQKVCRMSSMSSMKAINWYLMAIRMKSESSRRQRNGKCLLFSPTVT